MKALIIIDMQQCMSWSQAGERNNPQAEANIGLLLEHWRHHQLPIVHMRHISRSLTSLFRPGQSGCEFQPAFMPLASEAVFEKNVPHAFIQSVLERWLRVRDIHELVIVGVSTSNSVEATARTAGNLGFQTQVVSDATFTFAKPDFNGVPRSAEDVHAMSLANLQDEYAQIVSTQELLN